jgi:hypothetical protein
MAIETPPSQLDFHSSLHKLVTPTRRGLIAMAASSALLPRPAWSAVETPTTPKVAPFVREGAAVRDARIGKGLTWDGRAILPLGPQNKRVWLDTQAASSTGKGTSAVTPFRNEADAYAAMRSGDQLMIATGSVLTQPFSQLESLPGLSAAYPTVVQSYDRTAPTNEARYGLFANRVTYAGTKPFMGNIRYKTVPYVAWRGIRFDHSAARIEYYFGWGFSWLLIEQCGFFAAQLSLSSAHGTTVNVIRQTVFQGQWSDSGHSQGIYTADNFDTVIEDCIFFHCGWKMGVTRSAAANLGGPTIFNHGVYAAVKSGGTLRRCVFVEPSSHGAQLRGNWHSHDNVFISCPLPLLHGGGTTYALDAPSGVMALCYRNIVTIAQSISPTLPRGFGIDVVNTRPGSIVEQNLIVNPGTASVVSNALTAIAQAGAGYEPNPTVVTFQRNTNAWSKWDYAQGKTGRVFVTDKDNILPANKTSFADPSRDGLSAARALGFATVSDLAYGMAANPGKTWSAQIASHIRPGFAPRGLTLTQGQSFKGAVLPDGSWNAG